MDCECPVAGHCNRYKRKMLGRMYDICHGTSGLPEHKREAYQRLWLAHANGDAPVHPTVDGQPMVVAPMPPPSVKPEREVKVFEPHGPGTELELLWKSLKLTMKNGCPCRSMLVKMNAWGPDECRKRKQEIVDHLRKNQDKFGLTEKSVATLMAVKTGLAFKINWLDPFPDCVDIAIDRADKRKNWTIPPHP